jgi:hypothetical protein
MGAASILSDVQQTGPRFFALIGLALVQINGNMGAVSVSLIFFANNFVLHPAEHHDGLKSQHFVRHPAEHGL